VKIALLTSLLVLVSQPLVAETYKWVNEQGVVTYSQTPPPGQQAERVKLHGAAAPSGAQDSQSKLNELRQRLADGAEDRELAKQQQQEADAEIQRKKQNCESARSNLQKLEGLGSRLYQVDGQYRRLTEEERQQFMQQERDHIKENCGS